MAVEMNKSPSVRLTPVQEIKLAKPATELYIGQILKTVVVTALTNNQVLININGQNLNAKSSHHFTPGDILELKVVANQNETVLEVQQKTPSLSILQSTLLQTLPKQAPPTQLLQTMRQMVKSGVLPAPINQQVKTILNNIATLSQLPQQLMQAIVQSGVFLESALLKCQRGVNSKNINADFKGQCFKLLGSLPVDRRINPSREHESESKRLAEDPLPLPGAIPQPLHKGIVMDLTKYSPEALFHILREQVSQVLARITTSQINHLSQDNKDGFLILLDLPIRSHRGIDVIPIMIKQHKAEPMQPAKWSLSFALNLAYLGDMQTTVSLHSKNIDIKINTQNAATMNTLNEFQKEMSDLLKGIGMQLRDLKLQIGLENNHIDVANLRLLDIRI